MAIWLKKKKRIVIFCLIVVVLVVAGIVIIVSNNVSSGDQKIVETIAKEAEVKEETICTTLTALGEVKAANEEKLTLNTSYYYLTMCVEEDEFVEKGGNILQYTNGKYLVAPYDCVVQSYSLPTAKGKCTSSNYVSIASVDKLYMDINISEEQIDKISVGQEVSIAANYDETKEYNGTITKINAIGDKNNSGTSYAAIASLDNDGMLKLGMSATCTITIEKNENLLALPIEAVQIEDEKRYVNLVKDDSTEKVYIETGLADANNVQIISGLSLGDKVQYESTTVTVIKEDTSNQKNALTSLFNIGGNRGPGSSRKGGF